MKKIWWAKGFWAASLLFSGRKAEYQKLRDEMLTEAE